MGGELVEIPEGLSLGFELGLRRLSFSANAARERGGC
jgi:hypothetical protein